MTELSREELLHKIEKAASKLELKYTVVRAVH